jgi:hypothetical protein
VLDAKVLDQGRDVLDVGPVSGHRGDVVGADVVQQPAARHARDTGQRVGNLLRVPRLVLNALGQRGA